MRSITGLGHTITRYGRDIPHKHRDLKVKKSMTVQKRERRNAVLERRRADAQRVFSFPPPDFLTSTDTGTSKYEQYENPSFPWMRTQMKVEFSKYADTKFDIRGLRDWFKANILDHPGKKLPYKTVNEVNFNPGDWIVMPGYANMYNKILTMAHSKYPQELQGMMALMQGTSAPEVAAWSLYVRHFLTGADTSKGQLANVDSLWSYGLGKDAVFYCWGTLHRVVEDAYAQGTKGMTIAAFTQQFLVPIDDALEFQFPYLIRNAYQIILRFAQNKIALPATNMQNGRFDDSLY